MKVPKNFLPKKDKEKLEKLLKDDRGERLVDYFSDIIEKAFSECDDYDSLLKSVGSTLHAVCNKLPPEQKNRETMEILTAVFVVGWYSSAKTHSLAEEPRYRSKDIDDFLADLGYLFQELNEKYDKNKAELSK